MTPPDAPGPSTDDLAHGDAELDDDSPTSIVDELRIVIECADWDVAVRFYQRALGLKVAAGYATEDQGQLLLEAGTAFIELVHPELPGPEGGAAGPTELSDPAAPRVRLSFRSPDPVTTVSRLEAAGAERVSGPQLTSSHALSARLIAPDRLPVSVFESYERPGFSEPAMSPFHLPGSSKAPAVTPQQGLSSVIYSSRAVQDLSDDDLLELLTVSRRNNSRLGLTGVLLHRDGRFLQYLEGPEQVLRERIDIIAADPRHTSFTILLDEEVPGRLFPAWSMGFEKLSEHAAADIPGYRDSFADLSNADAEPGTRGALDQLSRWFASRSAGAQL